MKKLIYKTNFRLIFEFPPTGGVVAGYDQFNTVKLLKYVTAYDYAVLGLWYCLFHSFRLG